jgi:DNA topoisomerase-1
MKDETKFDRLEAFALALPRIRARVARDLQLPRGQKTPGRAQVLAALVRLLDTTLMRVGNEEYASSNGSYGLTTLRNRHAAVQGQALRLRFKGKSGVMHEARLDDPRVAKVVRQCQQLPGQALFQYADEDGAPHSVSSTDVNDYLAEAARGERFTAKDFRTWHGTVQALELTRLACEPGRTAADGSRYTAKDILAAVAKQLGNTPAVCKKAYVHPAVLALGSALADGDEATGALFEKIGGSSQARPSRGLHAAERRMLAFLKAAPPGAGARTARRVQGSPGKPGNRGTGPVAARKLKLSCRWPAPGARWRRPGSRRSRGLRPGSAAPRRRWPARAVRGARRAPRAWCRARAARPAGAARWRRRPRCEWRRLRPRCRAGSPAHRGTGSATRPRRANGARPVRPVRPVAAPVGVVSSDTPCRSKAERISITHCATSALRVMPSSAVASSQSRSERMASTSSVTWLSMRATRSSQATGSMVAAATWRLSISSAMRITETGAAMSWRRAGRARVSNSWRTPAAIQLRALGEDFIARRPRVSG